MKLKYRPELIAELEALVKSDQVDITSKTVKKTVFYQEIQHTEELDLSSSGLPPKILLLIAEIAATSPHLRSVNISFNDLGEHAPAIAKALANSSTIAEILMVDTNLGEYCPATAEALASLSNLGYLIISNNNLGKHAKAATATAKALVSSPTLKQISMLFNNLEEHDKAEVKAVFIDHNKRHYDLMQLIHSPKVIALDEKQDMPKAVVDIIGEFLDAPIGCYV